MVMRSALVADKLVAIGWLLLLLSTLAVRPVVHGDGVFYFGYVRSLVMDRDLNLRNETETMDTPTGHQRAWARQHPDTPTGHLPTIWPVGSSLLRLPFFLAAHGLVLALRGMGLHVAADGYSLPYTYAFGFASAFYALLGFYLMFHVALCYFAPRTAMLALALTWFATSAVAYTNFHPSLSHGCDLFIVSVFLYLWHIKRTYRGLAAWLGWGVVGGLMICVRPQNVIFVALPAADLLMNCKRESVNEKLRGLVGSLPCGALFAVGLLIGFFPQMLAWRVIFGAWIVNAYAIDPAARLDFRSPAFFRVLWSPLHGLFSWTPVVLIAVVGLWWLARKDRGLGMLLFLAFLLQLYLVGCWGQWWAGASFGNRFFIGCSPIFMLGLAALIEAVGRHLRFPTLVAIAGALIAWNLLFIAQYGLGLLPYEAPVAARTVAHNQVFVLNVLLSLLWKFIGAKGLGAILFVAALAGGLVLKRRALPSANRILEPDVA